MKDKMNILDVGIDCLSAKEAMKAAVGFMEGAPINTIEIVTLDMLMRGQDNPSWKEDTSKLDLMLPGEREILEAAGIEDKNLIRDVENKTFLKMFLKYLQKNHYKTFLMTESDEETHKLEETIRQYNHGIRIAGCSVLSAKDRLEEDLVNDIINDINGTETDCILSVLTAPHQEAFIAANSALLNARLWLGCGMFLKENYMDKKTYGRIRYFFLKKIFRYQVEKEKKEN